MEVDLKRVRVECSRQFGGVWLGYELLHRLGLIPFLAEQLAIGREDIPRGDDVDGFGIGTMVRSLERAALGGARLSEILRLAVCLHQARQGTLTPNLLIMLGTIGMGGGVTRSPLPHHRTCGSAYGGSIG